MGMRTIKKYIQKIACRLWNLSLLTVFILTFSNILLTIRLLNTDECPQHLQPESIPQPILQQLDHFLAAATPPSVNLLPQQPATCKTVSNAAINVSQPAVYRYYNASAFDVDLRLGRWDARHKYKMFDFALTGERYAELSDKFSVCLATQSSLEKLHSLVQVAHHWSGPISAAVFAGGMDEYNLVKFYIEYLRRCYAVVRERVSFHLAYAKGPPYNSQPDFANANLDCARPESSLIKLVKMRKPETAKWRWKEAYPQNHMRNLARRNCQSGYVFLTDVDIIPSARQAESLDVFLKQTNCNKLCAYVIPTYEIADRVRFPHNKTDLVRLAKKGLARPFHHKVFIYNQYATNFSRWETGDSVDKEMTFISHNVTNFEFLYEPFYVAPDTVPAHDERFMGYGYTRNTQVYEMFVAGYQFQVLSPIFTCHWGLQNKKGRPSWRERQNSANRRQFELFKTEVYARYHKDPLKMLQPKKAAG